MSSSVESVEPDPDLLDCDDDDDSGTPEKPCRKRPGRFRRWILRPLMWTLVAIIVLLAFLQLILDTPTVRAWIVAQVEQRGAALLDRPVELRDVRIQLVPLSVEIWGFTIGGPADLPAEQPFLHLPWVSVELDLSHLEQGQLRVREVRAERPQVYLAFFPEGESNILNLQRHTKKKRIRRLEVVIEHIEIAKAEIFLDQEAIRMSLAGDGVRGRLEGVGHLHVAGSVTVPSLVVRLPNARPYTASISARGSIQRGRVEVEYARATGPELFVQSSGVCGWPLDDPSDKKCTFKLDAEGRGEVLAELGYFQDLKGDIVLDGDFEWRPRTFGLRSRVTSPLVYLWGRRLEDFDGFLVSDRYSSRIAIREADYGGGKIDGSFEVEIIKPGRPSSVDINFRGVAFDTILADQKIPAGKCAARVNGNLIYRFPFALGQRGDGFGEFELVEDPDLGGLPLVGNFPLRIDDGVVRTDALVLHSDRQSVLANGWYDVQRLRGLFDYEIASADVAQLARVLQLAKEGEPWPEWVPSTGEGRIFGQLKLTTGDVATDVNVRLEKVLGPSVRTPQRMSGSFHVDKKAIDPINMQLSDGNSALLMRGRIPLDEAEGGEYDLTYDAFSWPLETVRPWLDFELDLDGLISGRMHFVTRDGDSFGRLAASVAPATVRGVPLDEVSSRFTWDAEKILFEELHFVAPSGKVTSRGTLTYEGSALDMDFRSASLEISASPIDRYLPRPDLSGEVRLEAHLGGSTEQPAVRLDLRADEIALGDRRLAGRPSELRLDWSDGHIEASGRLLDMVTLEGGGLFETHAATTTAEPARGRRDVRFDLDGHDLAGLLELLFEEPPEGVEGTFGGTLNLRGDGAAGGTSATAVVDLVLGRLAFTYQGRALENTEPVRMRLNPDHLQVGSLALREPVTASEISISGTVGYGEEGEVDVGVDATLHNSWFRFYQPDVRIEGFFDLLARARGTQARWHLEGEGKIRDAQMILEKATDFPHTFDNMSGQVLFAADGITVEDLRADLAGGEILLSGRMDPIREDQPLGYNFQIVGEDLRVRYPVGFLLAGDLDMTLRTLDAVAGEGGPEVSFLLNGRADLTNLEFNEDIPVGFAQILQEMLMRQRLEVNPADQLFSLIQLNVDVAAPEALRVRNNVADLTGSADLVVRGNVAQPIFLGEIELIPGGKIAYSGTDYTIERGRLGFSNAYRLDPEVDLVASTRLRDFEVTLNLSGTAERLNAGFTSEPPLPALEVFELLATGGERHDLGNTVRRADEIGEEESMSAASFLYGQAASVIGERVSNLFGFDKFRIDPLTGSGDNLSKARVTVGKRLSKDVFVSYSADPSSTEEQRLQIEWQIGRSLVLVLTQNGDNTYEVDARWETSF